MSDVPDRMNAALEGRYRIERHLGEGGMAAMCEQCWVRRFSLLFPEGGVWMVDSR